MEEAKKNIDDAYDDTLGYDLLDTNDYKNLLNYLKHEIRNNNQQAIIDIYKYIEDEGEYCAYNNNDKENDRYVCDILIENITKIIPNQSEILDVLVDNKINPFLITLTAYYSKLLAKFICGMKDITDMYINSIIYIIKRTNACELLIPIYNVVSDEQKNNY